MTLAAALFWGMIRARHRRVSLPLACQLRSLRVLYIASVRAEGFGMLGSERTDNQTRCTLISPKRLTCAAGKTWSLRRTEIKKLVVFIWGKASWETSASACRLLAESIPLFFIYLFVFGKRPRARICLPSVYLMKYLCGAGGTMANVCALCSGEKVQTKIEGNHLQYVRGRPPSPTTPPPPPPRWRGRRELLSRRFLPKRPRLC